MELMKKYPKKIAHPIKIQYLISVGRMATS